MPGFDLSVEQKAAAVEDDGTVVPILDREGRPMYADEAEKTPVTITVAGRYSAHYRRAEESIRKRPFKAKKLTSEVFYEDQVEKVVACTLAWEGFYADGKPFPLNRANAAALYQACPWVLDQVSEAMNDAANFSRGLSQKPPSTSGAKRG
jgi:hypothetical protein